MKKRALAMFLAMFMLIGCMSGCSSSDGDAAADDTEVTEDTGTDTSETEAAPVKTGSLTIGISTNALANIHNRHMFEGLKEEAESRGHSSMFCHRIESGIP